MANKKYCRDFFDFSNKRRPGRFDPMDLNYVEDAGDGIPGIQWMFRKILACLGEFFVIEGCVYDESNNISSGFIFMNGEIIQVSAQGGLGTLDDGECVYIGTNGVAHVGVMNDTVLNNNVITSFKKDDTVYHSNHQGGDNSQILGGNINVSDIQADSINLLPIGIILMYRGDKLNGNMLTRDYEVSESNGDEINMKGWFICNGQASTPNLQDKFIRCENDNRGNIGGSDSVTLEVNEIPAHNHSISIDNNTHNHTINGATGFSGNSLGNHTHGVNDSSATSGYSNTHNHSHDHINSTSIARGNHTHTFSVSVNIGGAHSHLIYDYDLVFVGGANTLYLTSGTGYGTTTPPTSYDGAHTHTVSGSTNDPGNHTHSINFPSETSDDESTTHGHYGTITGNTSNVDITHNHDVNVNNDSHNHTASSTNTGGGLAHENRPAFYSVIFIKRMI